MRPSSGFLQWASPPRPFLGASLRRPTAKSNNVDPSRLRRAPSTLSGLPQRSHPRELLLSGFRSVGATTGSVARRAPLVGSLGGRERCKHPPPSSKMSIPVAAGTRARRPQPSSKKADSSRLRYAPSAQWVPSAGESAASILRQSRKCRLQSPPAHEPAAHHDQVEK